MTEKELLEMAAKAAGYVSHGYGELFGGSPCLYLQEADFTGMWAPLTDDGDALRLAVKLDMSVDVDFYESSSYAYASDSPRVWAVEVWRDDKCAATRRAITRAAAAIGEGMK
jgi:hypothetical protein